MNYDYYENDNAIFRKLPESEWIDDVWTGDAWKPYEGDKLKPYYFGVKLTDSEVPAEVKKKILKYDESQPRDETGKWTSEGEGSKPDVEQHYQPRPVHSEPDIFVSTKSGKTVDLNQAREMAAAIPRTDLINTPERIKLRQEIADKLYGKGALIKGHQATIVMGLPGSGKTKVLAEPEAKDHGSLIIDADNAKLYLPEYGNGIGAAAVHEESAAITRQVLGRAISAGDNIVWATTSGNEQNLTRDIASLKKLGYTVHVQHLTISPELSRTRVIDRFITHGRFVDPDNVTALGNSTLTAFEHMRASGIGDSHAEYNGEQRPTRLVSSTRTRDYAASAKVAEPDTGERRPDLRLSGGTSEDQETFERLMKGCPDQPRDERGRWTSGEGDPAGKYPRRVVRTEDIPSPETQTKGVEGIKNYLQMLDAAQSRGVVPEGTSSQAKFVLDNGQAFTAGEHSYDGPRDPAHECFANAGQTVLGDPSRVYVEGYVNVHGVPLHHAWTVDKSGGDLRDTTVAPKGIEGYFGVPFKTDYVLKGALANKHWGLLGWLSQKSLPELLQGKAKNWKEEFVKKFLRRWFR